MGHEKASAPNRSTNDCGIWQVLDIRRRHVPGRRLHSSMYAAITDGLVGENTRCGTGSLLSRSVPRMRVEVCLHTGLCLRAKCLLFSPNSEDPRVVSSFSHGQLMLSGVPHSRSSASGTVTSCPAQPLMRPPKVLIELPLDRGKNRVQRVVIGGSVVLLRRRRCFVRETWRRRDRI